VSAEKEKNRLFAYIDAWARKVGPDGQAQLEEATGLVRQIYGKGSEGKKSVRHAEAQALALRTFRLVSLLHDVTNLQPIETLC
jgi:hypothetical protein